MPNPIIMPKLGQMTEDSTVVRWLKKEGDPVAKGDSLLEIETDKATMEVESFYDGTLLRIVVPEGETVPVMTTLAYVGGPGETGPEMPAAAPPPPAEVRLAGSEPSLPFETRAPLVDPAPAQGRFRISPRAASLALAHGVDARLLTGSGPGGRIIERDVRAALERPSKLAPPAAAQDAQPLSSMRRTIARRLVESYTTIPHFSVTITVDVTELERFRQEHRQTGDKASLTDFLVWAAARALQDFPACNSSTDGTTVVRHAEIHIGLAVALDEGLVVPVVRNADRLTVEQIATLTKGLVKQARLGTLTPDEMRGSSFTISNLGMLNVDHFTAIINPGESAILAVSSAKAQPVAIKDSVAIRRVMKMTLSADHRLVDGALAARFLNAVKDRLEQFRGHNT